MLPWRRTEWRPEPGPNYELRQYVRGRPTGVVAITAWDDRQHGSPRAMVSGSDVWLIRERTRLIITERRAGDYGPVRLQIPLRSCVDASIVDEPGLPGTALLRFTLTVRIGQSGTFTVPLWFPAEHRQILDDLARRIRTGPRPEPAPAALEPDRRPVDPLPLLDVAQAPDDEEWVVFRPSRSSDDVLAPRERRWAGSPGDRR